MIFPARQHEPVGEGKLLVTVLKVRRERDDLAVKLKRLAAAVGFQAPGVAPAREPLEQFGVGQDQRVRIVIAGAIGLGDPLDELPVGGRKQFLLVRGADDEVNEFAQRARLLAGARTRQQELHGQPVMRRFIIRLRLADDAERGARRVEQGQGGRRKPVLQFLHELLFLLDFLGPGKAVEAGVRLQFRRDGAFGAEEKKRELFQARLAGRVQQARPPVRVGEILAREQQLLEIILQQQPRALRIRAGREAAQHLLALVDGGLGIGKFAAQVRERAVGLRQHLVVGVVFRRARARAVSASD